MVSLYGSIPVNVNFVIAIEFDVNNNPIYVGEATPGTAKTTGHWRIRFLTFDVNNNPTDIQWAESNTDFDKVWDDRAAYAYG